MKKNKYTNGFKIPENYFEEFDARLLEKLKEEKQLPKTSGFAVPDGYFDSVEEKVIENIKTTPLKIIHNNTTRTHAKTVLYSLAGIAAVLAIIFTLTLNINNTYSFEEINATAVSAYIEDGELDLTTDDFALYLQDEDFDALMRSSEEISAESMSDYLLTNLDNNTLLFE